MEDIVMLTKSQAKQIFVAMDKARDAIQPVTVAQMKLHGLDPRTDQLLDEALALLAPKVGAKLNQG